MKRKTKSKFFTHTKCEYFPCHPGIVKEDFNCLFCYCPLHNTKECVLKTTVNFGQKDESYYSLCLKCGFPHDRKNYSKIIKKLKKMYRGI